MFSFLRRSRTKVVAGSAFEKLTNYVKMADAIITSETTTEPNSPTESLPIVKSTPDCTADTDAEPVSNDYYDHAHKAMLENIEFGDIDAWFY